MNSFELEFPLTIKQIEEKQHIYCLVRKKFVSLTPEEWVRQHVLFLLNDKKKVSYKLMAVERSVGHSNKRFDIVIYQSGTGNPMVLIECKRRSEKLSQKTFDQISRYNQKLNVPYLIITNWNEWMAARVDRYNYEFIDHFPEI